MTIPDAPFRDPCPVCGIPPDEYSLEPGAYEVLWDAVPSLREAQDAGVVTHCPECGRQLTFGKG